MEGRFKDNFQKNIAQFIMKLLCHLAEAKTHNTYQSTVSLLSAAVASGAK